MTTAFYFRLPKSFVPGEFLQTPRLQILADDARYFVSLILTKFARRDVDEDGYVRLMAKHLRSIMRNRSYSAVVDALLEGGAVIRSPYAVGENSFGYVLADRYRHDRHARIPATCPYLIGRLEAFHDQVEIERRARMLPVHLGLERHQRRLRIDGDLAREIISGLPPESNPFDAQGILVADIEHRDFHMNVGHYGRVANNVTSIKREVRTALRVNEHPLAHVDIACCQPALIAKKVGDVFRAVEQRQTERENAGENRRGNKQRTDNTSIYDETGFHPKAGDLERFRSLVQVGEFYDFMLQKLQIGSCPNFTRDQVKKSILADVIAKRKANCRGAEYPSKVEDCFRHEFPTVYRFIREVNRDGWEHENLIRLLQQEESKLVIETVAADLLTRHPRMFVLTLHDAIFTTPRDIPRVVAAFDRAFQMTGFPMTLKRSA